MMFKRFKRMFKRMKEIVPDLSVAAREITNAFIGDRLGELSRGISGQQPAGNAEGPGTRAPAGVQFNWLEKWFSFLFAADEAAALESWATGDLTPNEREILARRLKLIGDPEKVNTLPMRMLRKTFANMTPEVRKQTLKIIASDINDEAVITYLQASGAIDSGVLGMLVELWKVVNTRTIPWLQKKDKAMAAAIEEWDPGAFFKRWDIWKARMDLAMKERRDERGFFRRWGERSGFLARQSLQDYMPPESPEGSLDKEEVAGTITGGTPPSFVSD
ncbi:MAG: hypothetical protein A2663_02120 [Candidatus Buchananbacteria bacterium RIFCSPHIGHO2_01_FULL_46_12]|uniref:Uncharacterized protein n=2 Tax=Candidatus Buchananiibacteriota TaxID=1817903 RepID=A0A1G1Y7A9_9BACT|nr:MAG: hypothetical protein A2663_02120 [Candidatus Buchananbacteria bacterium RIFCSPHIGHO2_01_FULL_46_12]OGY57515.1 MAG: hypothetical protein A3H67_01835 [Candidatus Buchananbacteria bacterium RIFCSPLOWO2_02_FULL_46_11b]